MLYLINSVPYRLVQTAAGLVLRKDAVQFDLFGGSTEVPLTAKAKRREKLFNQPALFDLSAFTQPKAPKLTPRKPKTPKPATLTPRTQAPRVGDRKTEGGVVYQFNTNHRWEKVELPQQQGAIAGLNVIQDEPAPEPKTADSAVLPRDNEGDRPASGPRIPASTLKQIAGHYDQLITDSSSAVGDREVQSWIDRAERMISQYQSELDNGSISKQNQQLKDRVDSSLQRLRDRIALMRSQVGATPETVEGVEQIEHKGKLFNLLGSEVVRTPKGKVEMAIATHADGVLKGKPVTDLKLRRELLEAQQGKEFYEPSKDDVFQVGTQYTQGGMVGVRDPYTVEDTTKEGTLRVVGTYRTRQGALNAAKRMNEQQRALESRSTTLPKLTPTQQQADQKMFAEDGALRRIPSGYNDLKAMSRRIGNDQFAAIANALNTQLSRPFDREELDQETAYVRQSIASTAKIDMPAVADFDVIFQEYKREKMPTVGVYKLAPYISRNGEIEAGSAGVLRDATGAIAEQRSAPVADQEKAIAEAARFLEIVNSVLAGGDTSDPKIADSAVLKIEDIFPVTGDRVAISKGGLAERIDGKWQPVDLIGADTFDPSTKSEQLSQYQGWLKSILHGSKLSPDSVDSYISEIQHVSSLLESVDIDGASEGDRRVINGRMYGLMGGRWHRVDEDLKVADSASSESNKGEETIASSTSPDHGSLIDQEVEYYRQKIDAIQKFGQPKILDSDKKDGRYTFTVELLDGSKETWKGSLVPPEDRRLPFVLDQIVDRYAVPPIPRLSELEGSKEGDRRTINGRVYELRGGRWHRVDTDPEVAESATLPDPDAPVEPTPDQIPPDAPSPVGKIGESLGFDELRGIVSRIKMGDITADEIKETWQRFKDSRDFLRAELNKRSKKDLQKDFVFYGANQMKKGEFVERCLGCMENEFNPYTSLQYDPFTDGAKERALDAAVEKWTDEHIQKLAVERTARKEKFRKSLTNPETLEEFQTFIGYRGKEALTDEQLETYETLVSGKSKAERQAEAERKAAIAATQVEGVSLVYKLMKHTKTGADLHVVQLSDRVDRDAYNDIKDRAKKLGGYWSKFVNGFVLPSAEKAEEMASLQAVEGKERIEEIKSDRVSAAADRITEQANNLIGMSEEEFSRDRLVNTARRARMAAGIEYRAMGQKQLGETMLNVADAIRNGDVEFLDRLSTKAHFSQLEYILGRAKYDAIRAENGGSLPEREIGRSPQMSDIRYAEYPYPDLHKEWIKDLAMAGRSVRGLKQISEKMMNKWRAIQGEERAWRITFTSPSEIEDLRQFLTKMKAHADRKGGAFREKYTLDQALETLRDYDRMQRIDIKNEAELRTALREYLPYRGTRAGVDKVTQMERALIGLKIPGYFPTPSGLSDRVADLADIRPGHRVLEPSAGKGNLADAVLARGVNRADLVTIEPYSTLADVLRAKKYEPLQQDFLDHEGQYDRIVMNPPFENGQDIDHVRHAYDQLAPGGRMVAIMSEGPFFRSDKKASGFRDWLDSVNGYGEKLPEGSFKNSDRSTGVNTRVVVIDKPMSLGKALLFDGARYRWGIVNGSISLIKESQYV